MNMLQTRSAGVCKKIFTFIFLRRNFYGNQRRKNGTGVPAGGKEGRDRCGFLANPNQAIEKATGIPVPEDYHIRIIEQDLAYQGTYFLPVFVGDEVSDEDMEAVAGGAPKKGSSCIDHVDFKPCAADACGVRK